MANTKKEKVAPATVTPVTVSDQLHDTVSAPFQCVPNDNAPEGAEVLGGVVYKGTVKHSDGTEKVGFQAIVNGIAGQIKPQFVPAINIALTLSNVVPANYTRPEKWTDVYKVNKEPEPETLADLDAEKQTAFSEAYDRIASATEQDAMAAQTKRNAAFTLAHVVRSVRGQFANKTDWAMFQKFAPVDNGVKAFVGGKNTVNEYFRAGAIMDVAGFDADAMLTSGVSGVKGVISAYQATINAVAHNAVRVVRNPKALSDLGIAEGNDTVTLRAVLADMIENELYSISEAGEQIDLTPEQAEMAKLVIPVHVADWADDMLNAFDVKDASYGVLKGENGFVLKSKFGLEGADELATALARSLSSFIAKKEAAKVSDAADKTTAALTSAVKETRLPFADWPADMAARHLANILFSRYPEDGDEDEKGAAKADIDGILEAMGVWADSIFAENATVADILATDIPASEGDAEDDADA